MDEVEKDLKEAETKRRCNISILDGKFLASYTVEEQNKEGFSDYTSYEKIFDTFEDFSEYTQKFLNL